VLPSVYACAREREARGCVLMRSTYIPSRCAFDGIERSNSALSSNQLVKSGPERAGGGPLGSGSEGERGEEKERRDKMCSAITCDHQEIDALGYPMNDSRPPTGKVLLTNTSSIFYIYDPQIMSPYPGIAPTTNFQNPS
jgi:hypothetical protein